MQNRKYVFDDLGNLSSREDLITNQKETFAYDDLNRLTGVTFYKGSTHFSSGDLQMGFDNSGNITSKSDVSSSINYGENAGPHALTSIDNPVSAFTPPPQRISY
ncbi:MAG: hypothetical protein CSA96_08305, partial [Bacteroidetes bacterium]